MQQVLKQLSDKPHLVDELHKRWALRLAVNQIHLEQLKILQCEDYYTGLRDCGKVVGSLQLTDLEGVSSMLVQNNQAAAEIEQDKELEVITDYYMANIND